MPRHSQYQSASQSQGGSQVSQLPVQNEGERLAGQHMRILQKNLEFVQAQLQDVASTFADDEQADKVKGLRESTVQVLKLEYEVKAYLDAMGGFTRGGSQADGEGYAPDATKATDFAARLEEAAARALQSSQFDLSHSHALQAFDDATNNLGRGDAAAGNVAAQGGNEDDDDVVMGGGNQELLNNRCPITQRNVMELNQPVEDQYGYIYENEAIRATLANYACRGQPCACPIAGTTHRITVADLRPSERIKRAKRRAMLQRATQGNTQQQEDDVYDV